MLDKVVEKLAEKVVRIEDRVREELSKKENERIEEYLRKEKLIITFSPEKKIPASTLYWTLTAFKMHQYPPILAPYSSFITHIAPYHEQYSVIALVDDINILKPMFDFRRLLKIDTFILSENLPKQMKLLDTMEIRFEGGFFEKNIAWSLYLSILTLKSLASEVRTRRVENLLKEITNIGEVVKDMCKRFRKEIEYLAKVLSENVETYLLAPDYLLPVIEGFLKDYVNIRVYDISSVYSMINMFENNVIVVRTGVEEHMGRYVRFRLGFGNVHEIVVNVDPVSAPLYLMILIEAARKMAKNM